MSRFNIKKVQSGFEGWSGEQKILAEQGEVFKTPDGQIQKISNNAPSHDDEMRINKFGINKVNKGDGGVEIDADSVLSDSYRQVENGNREHNVKEQIVKIKPIEGESIAGQLGLDIRLKKAVSPSQLFLEIQKVKDKQVLKILGKSKNFINNRESANSNNINRSQISALPTDEEIYDAVFDYVENKKDESGINFNEEVQAQYGGEINSLEDDYFDNPLRNMINKIKNTPLYQDWEKIDNQYPTAKDKLSALTALTALAPNPYFKYGSLAINTGLDLIGNEMNDKVDLASNIMQIAGKKHQLPLRIGGQILGTSMDIINPSDDKFKVKKKQYGGSNNSLLSSLNLIPKGQYSTSIQRPINPFQIQKNQKEILAEELKKRQTYLSPKKQNNPNREYWERENLKKKANERINTRQDQTNMLGLALSPVPVLGEIYNTANTIANGMVDAAQGEYADAVTSLIPYGLSKISFVKNFTNNSKSPYNKNIGNYQKVLDKGEDIHDVRLKYHNNQLLDFDELSLLNLEGKGNPVNYKGVETRDKLGLSQTKNQKPLKVNKNNFIDELFGEDYSKVDTNINSSHNKNPNIESNVPAKHDFVAEEKNINYKNTLDFPNYNKIKPYQRTTTTRSADKWISDWYSNPETKKKFIDYGGTEEEWEQVLNSLENPILSGYNWGENRPLGLYSSKINKASVPLNSSVDAAVHEGIHKTKINLDRDFPMLPKLWNDLTDAVSEIPSEVYPELGRMRYNLKLKPNQNITMKQLDKGLETIMDGYNIPFKIKDKNKLLDIVNKMPSIVPLGVASEMSQQNKQYGGESSILKQLQLL